MIDFLIYSGYLILLINLILYAYSFFRKGKANVFFMSYLTFIFLLQFYMEIIYFLRGHNLYVINVFFIGQMILLGLFYNSLMHIKKQKLFVKTSIISALVVLGVQFVIDIDQFFRFNLFVITLTSLLIVVFALIHFYNMLTENKEYYYVSIGLVFYLLTSTVIYVVGNLALEFSADFKYIIWLVNAFFILIYYLFILYEWKVTFFDKPKIDLSNN